MNRSSPENGDTVTVLESRIGTLSLNPPSETVRLEIDVKHLAWLLS